MMHSISGAGLRVEINANGSIRRMDCGDTILNLFIGNELEGGPTNLYLRVGPRSFTELLGPRSPTRFRTEAGSNVLLGTGEWQGIAYTLTLTLSASAPAWFWHVSLKNRGAVAQDVDLIYVQDLALAPYGTVRLNEHYVSQYVDHTPLTHATRGYVVASRQNLAASDRNPWCVIGSLRKGKSFATDAMQVHGLAGRSGEAPVGIINGLPGQRLQHEHSMVAIQDEAVRLEPNAGAACGFFGRFVADHPSATSAADLSHVDQTLALPESKSIVHITTAAEFPAQPTLFSAAPLLASTELDAHELGELFGSNWRHEELDENGRRLSFFSSSGSHVVLRAKELSVQRPHGHLLRTGGHATPDEQALTSTTWMSGVFHSMLTQGHVSFNRLLSTVHSYIGLFRSHGQRVFVELDGAWHLLAVPSAFEMKPGECRWIYRHGSGLIEVRSQVGEGSSHELGLQIKVLSGSPVRSLISHHVALNGDDGSTHGAARWQRDGDAISIAPLASSDLGRRFPEGSFHLVPAAGTVFEQVGGDELLFADRRSRQQPYLCVITAAGTAVGMRLSGRLVSDGPDIPGRTGSNPTDNTAAPELHMAAPATSSLASRVVQLADIVPWYTHNAFIHYLSPRGLEQYSGGGWGTRDVCQGPVEMLLAFGDTTPVRDLLLRVMRAQSSDGDWPQWFMFFERECSIRAGDSHGDIVFWPVLATAQYLIASGDAELLEERVPFFAAQGETARDNATVWHHLERALSVIEKRVIAGTHLAAYGHGDWNDALQPADPSMREHMCSAWTVTLHHQTLVTLARALRLLGREREAERFEKKATSVKSDFQRLLLTDGVLTGYALFDSDKSVRYLLHPRDATSGVRYSSLAMIHAILEDMLTPEQARAHLQLIDAHLSGPDGIRLFDKPMPYHGGPQRFFQRAESATFFGREIGLMYMHAHLRYAQALAHMGETERFFHALCQANPIGIRDLVPTATARQANCYYSSSDAAFIDRYQASEEYERVASGTIALDGGWRVYSSGAGIALSLIIRRFLGLSREFNALSIDPVIPAKLDGLRVRMALYGRSIEVVYSVKGSGCGVTAIELNGKSLPLVYEANPHRKGAARIPNAAVVGLLKESGNVMRVGVGE